MCIGVLPMCACLADVTSFNLYYSPESKLHPCLTNKEIKLQQE